MILDLSALEKAIASLRRAVVRSAQAPEDTEIRDAVIQRFEYTYELNAGDIWNSGDMQNS